jgi:hypothetical protein
MLLVDNPPSTMQLIARSLIHIVERRPPGREERKRERVVEDAWKA